MPRGVFARSELQLAILANARAKRLEQVHTMTHCKNNHPLTKDNIRIVKRSDGDRRQCIQCAVDASKRYRKKNGSYKKPRTKCVNDHDLIPENVKILVTKRGIRRDCTKCLIEGLGRHYSRFRWKSFDREDQAIVARSILLEQAKIEATGELATLVAEQEKDEKQYMSRYKYSSTLSLDAVRESSSGHYTLYDVVAINDYQQELEDRINRLTGY